MATWGRKCTSCHVIQVPAIPAVFWRSTELSRHRLTSANVFFILFFYYKYTKLDRQIYESDLIYKNKCWRWGGAGQACCAGFSSVMKMVMMKTWQAMFGRQTMKDKNKCERLIATGIPRCWNRFLFCRFNCRLPQVSFDPPLQSRPILLDQDILNTISVEKDNNLWVLKNFSFKQQITLRVCGFSKNVSSHH